MTAPSATLPERLIQLQILAGASVGTRVAVSRFPFSIGRAEVAHLRLADAGVWDHHLELELRGDGVEARVLSPALATLNGEPLATARLRNGDTLQLGSATLRFWLAQAIQRDQVARERLIWGFLGALIAAQLAVIVWLAR